MDDCTRMSWVYFLKHKSEFYFVFVTFYNIFRTQFHVVPQILRSDNEGEYLNLAMKQFLSDHGMIHQTSYPKFPTP